MRKAQVVATKQQSHVIHEKTILGMMEHPFILSLVQTYQDAGELYMLMELALGGELFTLLAKRAPLFDQPAKFYSACVVSMFSYMHSLKVIYRDLKPENLLLDKHGYLKLVDFGFAKILTDKTWTLCGTPEYLAPEIILNKGHGYGADWWCVGILAFECLTGTTPFVSNDPMEGYRKIIKCRVPWPAQLSVLAKDFIDKLLCVDPTRRLGCLKGGSKDVRGHAWFQGIDHKALEQKALPAPYVPKIKSDTDDSNFDVYTDEGKANYPQEDFPRDMFAEFSEEWV
jgi:serine/threonine protein kinase